MAGPDSQGVGKQILLIMGMGREFCTRSAPLTPKKPSLTWNWVSPHWKDVCNQWPTQPSSAVDIRINIFQGEEHTWVSARSSEQGGYTLVICVLQEAPMLKPTPQSSSLRTGAFGR